MLAAASSAGIELCLVDPTEPLEVQGPFDAIIHKLCPNEGMFRLSSLPSGIHCCRQKLSFVKYWRLLDHLGLHAVLPPQACCHALEVVRHFMAKADAT